MSSSHPPPPSTPSPPPNPDANNAGLGCPVLPSAAVGRSLPHSSSASAPHGANPMRHSDVPEFVRRSIQEAAAEHGLSTEAAAAYVDQCRIFVVEVVNDNVRNLACYRRLAGQLGGLNKAKLPYLKKIILAVDGPQGVYGAANLHRNVHYQIGLKELPSFCRDLEGFGVPLYDVAASELADLPDGCAVLCPPNQSCLFPDEYFSLASADFVSDDCSEVVKELKPADIFRYLSKHDSLDPERGNLALHYGFQALNSTDTSRDDMCGFAAPTLGQPEGIGWSSQSLKDDMGSAMASMTAICDHATQVHGMDPLFGSSGDDRGKKYAQLIHPTNRAESLTVSLSPPDAPDGARYLLAHLDHLNDHADGYQYNVSHYGYFHDPVTGLYRRIHVGIYSMAILDW